MYPWAVRSVLSPLQERLKGKSTYARLRELEQTQWLTPQALQNLQFERLRHHLDFAYREVPYYTRLLDEHGLQPPKIHSLDDFRRIPPLTKDVIRRSFDALQPVHRLRGVKRMSSGGSTGEPVSVLVDPLRQALVDAGRIRAHRWFGVDVGALELALWGSPIEITNQDFVRRLRDYVMNSRLLSAFDLGETALARYADILHRYRPTKIISYPNAIHLLACFLESRGWTAAPEWPKAIFTTAEMLHDYQRKKIQTVFGCPVADEYGCREGGLIASECPAGSLHVNAESILVETINVPTGQESVGGEIVITNFMSFAMPIIRYRTGDMGELDELACSCGRGLPVLRSVQGRRSDFLVTSRGRIIHGQAAAYLIRETPAIRDRITAFQVMQDRYDHLLVRVVPDDRFSPETKDAIVQRLGLLFSDAPITIDVEEVAEIARAPSGKYRDVISTIADKHLERLLGL